MTILTNANLRGIRLTSDLRKDDINQYLIVIDQPETAEIDPLKFHFVEPTADGTTSFNYTYDGTLVDPAPGERVKTYRLPICWSHKIAAPNEAGDNLQVTVTDNQTNSVSGNPNAGKPPILKFMNRDGTFTAATAVVMSLSNDANSNPLGAQLFLVFLVNTLPNGGFAKLFESVDQSSDRSNLVATLKPEEGKQNLLTVGVYDSIWDQFGYLYVKNPVDNSMHGPFFFNYLEYSPL